MSATTRLMYVLTSLQCIKSLTLSDLEVLAHRLWSVQLSAEHLEII